MYEFLQTIMPNVVKTAPELWECFLETITMVGVSALMAWKFPVPAEVRDEPAGKEEAP